MSTCFLVKSDKTPLHVTTTFGSAMKQTFQGGVIARLSQRGKDWYTRNGIRVKLA